MFIIVLAVLIRFARICDYDSEMNQVCVTVPFVADHELFRTQRRALCVQAVVENAMRERTSSQVPLLLVAGV